MERYGSSGYRTVAETSRRWLLAYALLVGGMGSVVVAPVLAGGTEPVAVSAQATPSAGATPVAAGGCFVDSSGVEAEPWVRSELFFGTTRPDGSEYTEEEWLAFLDDEVTPRFPDGLTVLTGIGQFLGSSGEVGRETSKVLIILYPAETAAESSVLLEEIRDAYEEQFEQESVLRADDSAPVCTSF